MTSAALQPDLFGEPPADQTPHGFGFWTDVLSANEQSGMMRHLEALPFQPYEHLGYLANRRVAAYGRRYDLAEQRLETAAPWPGFLVGLMQDLAARTELDTSCFMQALVNEYQPGAGIGWHRDRVVYGEILGVSLGAPCVMRLRRETATGWTRASVELPPGSVYRLSGEVRHDWEHSIAPMEALRYSVTFRTLSGTTGRFVPMGAAGRPRSAGSPVWSSRDTSQQ